MDFTIETQDFITIIRITGAIGGGEDVRRFQAAIQQCLQEERRVFLVSCKQVAHINSTGLGILVAALTAVKNAGGRFVLCDTEPIDPVLQVTRMQSVFENQYDEAYALQLLQKEEWKRGRKQ